MTVEVVQLIDAQTGTGEGTAHQIDVGSKSFEASVKGSGSVSATILVKVRNDANLPWKTLATITLSGTTSAADGFVTDAPWKYWVGEVTAISGTSAKAYLNAGKKP